MMRVWLIMLLTLISLTGCSPDEKKPLAIIDTEDATSSTNDSQDSTDTTNDSQDSTVTTNVSPVVNAGADQTLKENTLVTLSGSATDSDGAITTTSWLQTSGTPVMLSNISSLSPTFTAPESAETLIFQLTVTDNLDDQQTDTVKINVEYIYNAAPTITVKTYTQQDPDNYVSFSDCGSFEPNHHSFTLNTGINELNAGHVAFYWGNDFTAQPSETANILQQLISDTNMQQLAINNMQGIVNEFITKYGVDITPSVSLVDGKCYRVNIYFYGTGLWTNDTIVDYGGGARCEGYTSVADYKRIPTIELNAGVLKELATITNVKPYYLTHEFTHTMQCKATGRTVGWDFYIESLAQFVANDMSNGNVFSSSLENEKFLALDSYFNRYASSPFWIYVRHEFGDLYMGDLLKRTVLQDEYLIDYLIRTAPFNCADNDTQCRKDAFANFYGRFAASTVNYVAASTSENTDFNNALKVADGRNRKSSQMEKISDKHYRIVDRLAPQRYGRNIIELVRDTTTNIIEIKLDGWDIPERQSQWRATVVATLDSTVSPRLEAMQEQFTSGTQVIDINQWEAELNAPIESLHIAIAAVPLNWKRDSELSPFSSLLRHRELDQYVYELSISGAWPKGHEPHTLRETPVESGAAHANGGGFVADLATVVATAYVGSEARVQGTARVLDNARIEGRAVIYDTATVQNNVIVSGNAEIYGNATASDFATIRDNNLVEQNASISGEAKLLGDSIYYNTFSMTDKSVAIGTPLIWNTSGGLTLSGTAIINGHEWLGNSAINVGTPYDGWSIDAAGLFLHYDFSRIHPYRIEDIHATSDAYFLDPTGKANGTANFVLSETLSSQVIALNGNGYIALPKMIFDFHNYQLEMLVNWQGNKTEFLLDSSTDRGEKLSIQFIPNGTTTYDVILNFVDRNAETQTLTLTNNMLIVGQWIKLAINYNSAISTIKLLATSVSGSQTIEASAILPSETREFDYDSLSVRLGADMPGNQLFNGRIEDVKLIR